MAHSPQYIRLMNAAEWRRVRNKWLSEHPLCQMHKEQGKVVPARCVHHITPVESAHSDKEMRTLAYTYSPTNLMSLCYECHAQIHAAERSHTKQSHQQREYERHMRFRQRLVNPKQDFNL